MINQSIKLGELDNNLTLQTKGKVYIQFGKKSIDLLNDKGELNVNLSSILKKVSSLKGLTSGLYEYQDNLYIVINGKVKKIQLEDVSI